MVTHQDVAGVTGQLDNLSQTLMRKQVMRQQDRQFEAEQATRSENTAEARRRTDVLEQQYKLGNTFKKLADFRTELQGVMQNIAAGVAQDPTAQDAVSQYFADVIEQQDPDIREALKKDPSMRALLDGKINWKQIAESAKTTDNRPKPFEITTSDGQTENGIYNPKTGRYERTTPKPLVGSETTTKKTITPEGDEVSTTTKQPFRVGAGKALDKTTAAAILKEAGNDAAKARELAKQRGYSF